MFLMPTCSNLHSFHDLFKGPFLKGLLKLFGSFWGRLCCECCSDFLMKSLGFCPLGPDILPLSTCEFRSPRLSHIYRPPIYTLLTFSGLSSGRRCRRTTKVNSAQRPRRVAQARLPQDTSHAPKKNLQGLMDRHWERFKKNRGANRRDLGTQLVQFRISNLPVLGSRASSVDDPKIPKVFSRVYHVHSSCTRALADDVSVLRFFRRVKLHCLPSYKLKPLNLGALKTIQPYQNPGLGYLKTMVFYGFS